KPAVAAAGKPDASTDDIDKEIDEAEKSARIDVAGLLKAADKEKPGAPDKRPPPSSIEIEEPRVVRDLSSKPLPEAAKKALAQARGLPSRHAADRSGAVPRRVRQGRPQRAGPGQQGRRERRALRGQPDQGSWNELAERCERHPIFGSAAPRQMTSDRAERQ